MMRNMFKVLIIVAAVAWIVGSSYVDCYAGDVDLPRVFSITNPVTVED
jgi:hypothetical protein